jgi:hypothetical protein
MITSKCNNIGDFQEVDYGHYFTYRLTDNPWAISHGLTHEVDVGHCGDEREACAKVCDDLHPGLATKRAAELIRARGNT